MYLRKLEIQGFKSFAKKTALEFEQGITSIVGPNGSGKSNIADSLRWAFGEQSMKALRGKKSEDVIFAGSDQRSRMGYADVTVHFDNSDGVMPIDYSEVVIGRRLYRDGNSEYLINNNQVRLMDIQDLLAKSGFAQSSYHVIGQGMIDQLILGGPQAVKEVVEEAAGIKPYYKKRKRTLRRLERTENNLDQVRALIKEIKPRLNSLRRQTKRFEQRAEIEKELKKAQIAHFAGLFRDLDKQKDEVAEKIKIFDKQINELTEEIEKLSAEIEQKESRGEAGGKSFSEIREKLSQLHTEKHKLLEQQAVLRGQIKARQLQPKQSQDIDWVNVKSVFQKINEKIRDFFSVIRSDKGDVLTQLRTQADELESMFDRLADELEDETDREQNQNEADKKELKKVEQRLTEIQSQIKQTESKLDELTEKEEKAKKKLFALEKLFRNKQDTLVKTRDEKNSLSIEEAKFETRKETYAEEAKEILGEDYQKVIAEFQGPASSNLQEKIHKLKSQLEKIGTVDDLTMQEYEETEERYAYLTEQLEDLEKSIVHLKKVIKELDEVIKKEFSEAYNKISDNFSEYFRILFGGGKATMNILRQKKKKDEEEEDEDDEDVEDGTEEKYKKEITGIQINATPPGKKLAGIASLSGGERALTAIAFLSALLASYPTPFVVLDEVDAALDEANSVRFGKILAKLADETQFITITHNRETMRQSHTLYGVTMGDDGVSKILSLKLDQAAAYSSGN